MSVRVIKKSSVALNTLIFVILSLPFLHIVKSLGVGESALNWAEMKYFLFGNHYAVTVTLFLSVAIYRGKKFSIFMVPLLVAVFFSLAISYFLVDFNKHILFLSFIYLIIGFYTCLFWNAELKGPIYRPGFDQNMVGKKSEYELKGFLTDKNNQKFEFYLTNWDEESCFMVPRDTGGRLKGKVSLQFYFGKHEFSANGTVVSQNSEGFGIFLSTGEQEGRSLGWKDYYAIISDRGYHPRFV